MTMNPTSDHLDDETLSALLDGDAAESDGGSVDAAAHLRACDRCSGRQSELAGVRAALAAAPVEPLDELTRRRLVAGALQAIGDPAAGGPADAPISVGRAGTRWAQRHTALIGSAAAVVLAVLVGVPFVLGNDKSTQEHTALSAQAPEALDESAGTFLGDLGDLTDRQNLRLRLSGVAGDSFGYAAPAEPGPSPAAGTPVAAPVPAAAPAGGGLAGTSNGAATTTAPLSAADRSSGTGSGSVGAAKSAPPGATSAPEAATADDAAASQSAGRDEAAYRDRADIDRCVAALLDGPARGGRLTRSGTGTYKGRPAVVASFELDGGTTAFVTDRSSCEVLDRFPV
jgi:hypothetical protein